MSRRLDIESIKSIVESLEKGDSISIIAKEHSVSRPLVSNINQGKTQVDILQYLGCRVFPISKRKKGSHATEDQAMAIAEDLMEGAMSHKKIAEKYGVSQPKVSAINNGDSWGEQLIRAGYTLPIRDRLTGSGPKITEKMIVSIVKDMVLGLRNKDIAKKYDISLLSTSLIRNGKSHKKFIESKGYIFPLKPQ